MEAKVKESILKVFKGDILELNNTDVIVCPTTPDLWMGKGLAYQILNKGGDDIYKEAKSIKYLVYGDVLKIKAGRLPFKSIYFTSVISREVNINRDNIIKAVTNCLRFADNDKFKTIGFPMLGSSTVKAPYDTYASLMLRSTINYLFNNSSGISEIIFCLFNQESYDSFKEQLYLLKQEYLI